MKASKLIKYLKKKGYKGEPLAQILGVTRATISHLESDTTGKLNFQYIEKTAHFLNISTKDLLDELE